MSLTELQNYTFVGKYARWIPEKKRRETWKESVNRVKNMMYAKYPKVNGEIEWAYDLMHKKRVLGSQRALQFGGDPIFKHHARVYNCIASYCDRLRFFQECMYLLLCGCGVGFSVQGHHIKKLPRLVAKKEGTKKFTIPDTIEGWSDSIGVLISSYFEDNDLFPEYEGKTVNFDFSNIRPAGAYLSSSSGKAPGPEPLKKALANVKKVLDKSLKGAEFSSRRLNSIDAYDVVMHSADAVISGGVRRSATICLFSPDDKEMALAKTGNWFHDNPQRGRSNNSALLLREGTTPKQFSALMDAVKEFGEPGFVWSDSTELIVNPCVEIGLYPVDEETGKTGWQACNLSTINCAKVNTKKEFFESCRAAAIIGTLQAGFTDLPYLGEISEREYIYQQFKKSNPRACEESVWSSNETDDVISFCIEVPAGSKLKNKIGAIGLLEYVKSTQKNWVMGGRNESLCVQPFLQHNVSNTINVKPEEWEEVEKFIYKNRKFFCGVSLLPVSGDKDYPQAPFTTVYLPSEMVSHYGDGAMFVSGLIEVALNLWEDNLWTACDSMLGLGDKIKGNGKKEWALRCQRFADKYMDGDVKRLTYCMKDVYNWKEWVDVKRSYQAVEYTTCIEEHDNTKLEQELACAGGKCELI